MRDPFGADKTLLSPPLSERIPHSCGTSLALAPLVLFLTGGVLMYVAYVIMSRFHIDVYINIFI